MNRIRPQVLTVFLISLCLLMAGMRVPDIARPHRPKPNQRAVVTSQAKTAPELYKCQSDLVAMVPTPITLTPPLTWLPASHAIAKPYLAPALILTSGRSPPTARS